MSRGPDELARGCRQAQRIGAMLVLALAMYAFVVEMIRTQQAPFYGLVLFMLGGQRADFYGFAAFALLALAVYFPRRSQWEAWAHQA